MNAASIAEMQVKRLSDMKLMIAGMILCLLIVVGGMLVPTQVFGSTTTTLDLRGTRDYAMAFQVLDLVNVERAKLGRDPVKMDTALLEAAMLRAAESRLFFSHTRPSGQTPWTVFPAGAGSMSENIAIGQVNAVNVMTSWINSSGHYNNLMNPSMTSIGVGCFELGGVRAWVQLFTSNHRTNAAKPVNRVVVENVEVREDWLTIGVAPSTVSIAVGTTQALTTTVRVTGLGTPPQATWGAALPVESSSLQYTSASTTIATVNTSGTVTGVRGGTTTVSVAPKGSTQSASASVTVTAPVYTVTYNANGGAVSPTSNAVNQGSSVTLPTPTRSGWTFNGWFTAATGGTKINSPYTPTANITLFAQWTQITHVVTYNATGGSVSPASSTVNAGSSVTLPTPTRSGYIFNGWFTAASGGTKVNSPYTPTAAITLFAQWTENPAGTKTVTFDRTDGSAPTSQLVDAGTAIGAKLPVPTRTGYTFAGWFTAATGGTKVTATYVVNDDVTFYARWTPKKYTIKYYSSDGKTLLKSESVNFDSKLNGGSYAPKIVGKTFSGWFTAKTGGTKVTEVKGNQSVYARYVTTTYTVKYYNHAGTLLTVSPYSTKVKHNGAPAAGPKRTGYTFIGWFTAKSGGTQVTKVTKNQSLYARYKINQYTTKYYDHAGKLIRSAKTNYNTNLAAGPKRTGYTFQGWFTARTGGTKITKVTKNQTVYAQYKINKYTIKYYDGNTLLDTKVQNYNTNPMAGPYKLDYRFDGWFTAKSGGTKVTKITSNQTLYARYTRLVYVTKTGTKYHRSTCTGNLNKSMLVRTLAKAKAEGYEACKTCKP